MNMNYEDRSLFKATQKKWEVIQVVREAFLMSDNINKIYLLKSHLLIKGRNESLIENIFNSFKKDELFKSWEKENDGYYIFDIKKNKFESKYLQMEKLYKKLAEAQDRKQKKISPKIIIHKNGFIERYSSMNKYEALFKIGSNDFLLLRYLASPDNLSKTFTSDELAKKINQERQGWIGSNERRIRDTIQSIRKKLSIKKADDPFIVSGKRFGLDCDIEFAK